MQCHPSTDRITALHDRLSAQLDLDLPELELQEMPTDITVRDVAGIFGMKPDVLTRALHRYLLKPELLEDERFMPWSNCFIRLRTGYLLVWQIEPAIEIAWEVYYRAMHRPSSVTVTRLVGAS